MQIQQAAEVSKQKLRSTHSSTSTTKLEARKSIQECLLAQDGRDSEGFQISIDTCVAFLRKREENIPNLLKNLKLVSIFWQSKTFLRPLTHFPLHMENSHFWPILSFPPSDGKWSFLSSTNRSKGQEEAVMTADAP